MANTQHNRRPRWWQIAIIVVLAPFLMLAAILALALFVVEGLGLRLLIWAVWCPRGRDILFVYSDSPIWHDEIENQILPNLGDRAVVLNWSERKGGAGRWLGERFVTLALTGSSIRSRSCFGPSGKLASFVSGSRFRTSNTGGRNRCAG